MDHTHFIWKSGALACSLLLSSTMIYAANVPAAAPALPPVKKQTAPAVSEEDSYQAALALIKEKKYGEAFELLAPIADGRGARFQDACWQIVILHMEHHLGKLTPDEIRLYLEQAGERDLKKNLKGNADAQSTLAGMYLTIFQQSGERELWQASNQYAQWAAEQGSNADAWLFLSALYQMAQQADLDDERAYLCLMAAERMRPDSDVASSIGYYYFLQGDYANSAKWFKIAAERVKKENGPIGDVAYMIGFASYGAKDYAQARKYMMLALAPESKWNSELHGEAHLFLGYMDFHDLAIEKKPENKVSAYGHFLKAARDYQNHEAAFQLACCNEKGIGVKKDPDAAKVWMNFARMSKMCNSYIFTGEKLRELMGPEKQTKKTKELSAEWKAILPWYGILKKDYGVTPGGLEFFYKKTAFVRALFGETWLTPPVADSMRMQGWSFDSVAFERELESHLAKRIDGEPGWKNEKYKDCPLDINLLVGEEKQARCNGLAEEKILAVIRKAGGKECDPATAQKVRQEIGCTAAGAGESLWSLGKDRYVLIRRGAGKENTRFCFIGRINGKLAASGYFSFDVVPDDEMAAMVHGVLENDALSMNKLAVYWIKQRQKTEVAVELLTRSMEKGCAAAAYNLGRLAGTGNVKLPMEAAQYFAKAKEIAGSSVLYPGIQRPEIMDRNGVLLVENKIGVEDMERARSFTQGSAFATPLIGHTQVGRVNRIQVEEGRTGVEYMIDERVLTNTVYMALDTALQKRLETVVRKVTAETNPRYISGIVINSKGELIAATQAPYFDFKERYFLPRNPIADRDMNIRCDFIPAQYLFPVPDEWMKLLGSSSNAAPESKEKFKLHVRTGLFLAEAEGIVPGLNKLQGEKNPKKLAGQSATLLNYLLAYISVAEKKEVPKPVVYAMKKFAPVKPKGGIRWISFYRPPDGIVVNALGVIETEDPNEKLYVVVRSVYEERNYGSKLPEVVQKAADADGDKAEAILRKDGI